MLWFTAVLFKLPVSLTFKTWNFASTLTVNLLESLNDRLPILGKKIYIQFFNFCFLFNWLNVFISILMYTEPFMESGYCSSCMTHEQNMALRPEIALWRSWSSPQFLQRNMKGFLKKKKINKMQLNELLMWKRISLVKTNPKHRWCCVSWSLTLISRRKSAEQIRGEKQKDEGSGKHHDKKAENGVRIFNYIYAKNKQTKNNKNGVSNVTAKTVGRILFQDNKGQ